MIRRLGRALLCTLFGLFAAADLIQLVQAARGRHPDPAGLLVTHAVTGVLAGLAMVGICLRRRWAAGAVLGWGTVTAGMLVVLGPAIQEPREAWRGFWIAAGTILVFSVSVALAISSHQPRA